MSVSDWKIRSFGEFCRENKVLNSKGEDLTPLSVTKSHGVVLQATKFKKRIAIADTTRYKVLRKGEFVYDPMSLYYGAIGRLKTIDQGIVSPAYITFDVDSTISPEFFWYLAKSELIQKEFVARTEGGNFHGKRKKTDWEAFCSVALPLPPLAEQRKIAAILSTADEAIQTTQSTIEQTRKVKQGLLQDLLIRGVGHTRFRQTEIGEIPEDWELTVLEDLARPGSLITYGVVKPGEDDPSGVLFIRGGDFPQGHIRQQQLRRIPRIVAQQYRRTTIHGGEVLVSLVGQPGASAVVPPELAGANIARQVALVRPGLAIRAEYLHAYLQSATGQQQLRGKVIGSVQQVINLSALKQLLVPVPQIEEQDEITLIVRSVTEAEATLTQELDRLGSLKRGLVQDLLTGRVRVPSTH